MNIRTKPYTKQEKRENLEKLANYLESLPDGYEHFDMDDYFIDDDPLLRSGDLLDEQVLEKARQPETLCGSVACAIGHGLAAGVDPTTECTDWNLYTENCYLPEGSTKYKRRGAYDYLFSSYWASVDNTPKGAAKRIRRFLADGEKTYPETESDREFFTVNY